MFDMKLKHIAAVATLALFLPVAVSALTAEEITAQIRTLLAQVALLKEQLNLVQPKPPTPAVNRICPQILRQLSQGTRGDDVASLQAYLGVDQTGYFGPLTASAVMKFQSDEGISRVGTVGPQTRAAFARRCGNLKQDFSVTPTSGSVPLTVAFQMPGCTGVDGGYSVDFGDGTGTGAMTCGEVPYPKLCRLTHVYTVSGTYHAQLMEPRGIGDVVTWQKLGKQVTITVGGSTTGHPVPCPAYVPPTACPAGQHHVATGPVTYDSQGCYVPAPQKCVPDTNGTFSAAPTSGSAPLAVSFSGTVNSAGYSIDFGDGTSSGDVRCGHGGCPTSPSSSSVATAHTYNSAGTYVAKLRQHFSMNAGNCAGVDCNVVGTATITVGNPISNGAVYGIAIVTSGNCMPSTNGSSCGTTPAAYKTVYVHQRTTLGASPSANPTTPLVAQTQTDAYGAYRVSVPPGNYSIFIDDAGRKVCAFGDGNANACPVTVGQVAVEYNINNNTHAVY